MSRTRTLLILVTGLLVGTIVAPIGAFSGGPEADSASGIAAIKVGNRCKVVDAGMDVTADTKVAATVVSNIPGVSVQRVARLAGLDRLRICLAQVAAERTKVAWIAHNGSGVADTSHVHDPRDHAWSARVSATGTKIGTGPYTAHKFATGHYGVQFDVEAAGFSEAEWFTTVASPVCAGYTASVSHGGGASISGGKLTAVTPNIKTYDVNGNPADCSFSLMLTFDDPNPGLIVLP